jgi:hypothetical protein
LPDYTEYGVDREWEQTRQTLAAFPVWDLTDHVIAVHIGHLRSAAAQGQGIAKRYASEREVEDLICDALLERVLACKATVTRAEIELRARLESYGTADANRGVCVPALALASDART